MIPSFRMTCPLIYFRLKSVVYSMVSAGLCLRYRVIVFSVILSCDMNAQALTFVKV